MDIDVFYWDHSYTPILLLNFAIVIGLFTSLRLFSGTISHIDATDELLKKDNPAFGVSLLGAVLGLTIMLSGTIYGDPSRSLQESAIAVGLYGIVGIVLMALTRVIFDKIALPRISIRDEIVKGNLAAGFVDAGNVIATAIIIRAVMVWIPTNNLDGVVELLIGYVISQVILTGATYIRIKIFSSRYKGKSIQDYLHKGNTALALRFAGRRIGTAFAITAASQIMVYEVYDVKNLLVAWALISVLMILVLAVLSFIADKIILYKVDVEKEILSQKNNAIGEVQAIIYISLGLLLSELVV